MWTWVLISRVTGWLPHYQQLKHSLCQYWESIRHLALIALFLNKAQNFLQHSMQPCFQTWTVVRNRSHHPPPVSCATHLAKAQIHWVWRKKKTQARRGKKTPQTRENKTQTRRGKKWCLNAKPLLLPAPSCALQAVLAEPPGHSYHLAGSARAGSAGKADPLTHSLAPESFSADEDTHHHVGLGSSVVPKDSQLAGKATSLPQGSFAAGQLRGFCPG